MRELATALGGPDRRQSNQSAGKPEPAYLAAGRQSKRCARIKAKRTPGRNADSHVQRRRRQCWLFHEHRLSLM